MKIRVAVNMILAGDFGGTRARLGLFDVHGRRPVPRVVRAFGTADYADALELIEAFVGDAGTGRDDIAAACFGVAGPVTSTVALLTNASFRVDATRIGQALGIPQVTLLNDLQAMAWAIPVLADSELHVLQKGRVAADGRRALIAAGTGLGQAVLHPFDGRFVAAPSEAGHADWAARTDREIDILRALRTRFGRAEVEQVVSGMGLVNLHRVTHAGHSCTGSHGTGAPAPADISAAALSRRCAGCAEALDLFVAAYGAEAGNLALRTVATGGLFVGGGIAPKILPALTDGRFLEAFLDKGPFRSMLEEIPVAVILEPDTGLLGAAVAAAAARS